MQIHKITPYGFGSNSYILTKDGKNALVIDPSGGKVKTALERLQLNPAYVLLTHCHFDHVYGVPELQGVGAKVVCGEQEKPLVGTNAALSALFGAPDPEYTVNETLADNERRDFCGLDVLTMLTAGHTKGSVTYLITDPDTGERALFTGDTLFESSIGRTDFPTGNLGKLRDSLKKLSTLDESLHVYSGHGEDTTIGREKRTNPFLVDL
jgi:glyoxylase-like metal-dependent hydrolase (beta-lactamase superfamily II)